MTDYAELKLAVTDWVNRDDLPVAAMINLAEHELRSALPPICPPLPSLSDAFPTNWLIETRPDVYLAAVMVEANCWMLDDERAGFWRRRVLSKIHGPFVHAAFSPITESHPPLWRRMWAVVARKKMEAA